MISLMFPFAVLGIKDALNPCLFSVVLLFYSYIGFLSNKFSNYKVYFTISIIFSVLTRSVLVGVPHISVFFRKEAYSDYFFYFYICVAVLLVIFGCFRFYDWFKMRNSFDYIESIKSQIGFFNKDIIKGKNRLYIHWILLSVIIGVLISVVSLAWGESSDLYIGGFLLTNEGLYLKEVVAFLIYGIGYAIPLWLFLIVMTVVSQINILSKLVLNQLRVVNIIISAIYISSGIGLGIILFR